jgi:membrane protein
VYLTWHITLLGSVMIRAMQYMKITFDFKREVKNDDLSISINMLGELYKAQKNLSDGISIDHLYKRLDIADYDKIKSILYTLEQQNIVRIASHDICYLNCDVFDLSLRKIYIAFNPTLSLKNSCVTALNTVKSDLYQDLDIKLYDCFKTKGD